MSTLNRSDLVNDIRSDEKKALQLRRRINKMKDELACIHGDMLKKMAQLKRLDDGNQFRTA